MDRQLRELERLAAQGDPTAKQRLALALCRLNQHEWASTHCIHCKAFRCDYGGCIWNDHQCYACKRIEPQFTLINAIIEYHTRRKTYKYFYPSATCYDKDSKKIAEAYGWVKGMKKAPKSVGRKMKKAGLRLTFYEPMSFGSRDMSSWRVRKWKDLPSDVKSHINGLRWYPGR